MTIRLLHPERVREATVSGRAADERRRRRRGDIDPELVVALARQVPAFETDALVRLITSSLPEATSPGRRAS